MANNSTLRWLGMVLGLPSKRWLRDLVLADGTRPIGSSRDIVHRAWKSSTLWYHRLQTDKDPRYSVSNLLRLQEDYDFFDPAEKAEVGEMITRIVGHLVMPNGTPMVSRRGRHREAMRIFLERFGHELARPSRVLELASSLGIDGLEIQRMVDEKVGVAKYCMTDLHTHLLYDPCNQIAYDADGRLVQTFVDGRAISVNVTGYFVWSRWLMRLINMPHASRARRIAARASGASTIAVSLLHPEVLALARRGGVQIERQDVLHPIEGTYDVVIAFNLLVPYYFSARQLRTAAQNITACLPQRGFLVVGEESTDFSIWSKDSGQMVMRHTEGVGSAFDHFLIQ